MNKAFNRQSEKQKRRAFRNNMPKAEVILWNRLKRKQLLNTKFRRQYSVGPYILDFYSPQLKLAIELDGDSHFQPAAKTHDARRDEFISKYGISIIRINNNEIYDNLDNVLEYLGLLIRQISTSEKQSPPVSPLGKGGSLS